MEHSPHLPAQGSLSDCAFPGAGCLTPLTLVRDHEASSNPKAFTINIMIPDLNLPEITNVVRDWWGPGGPVWPWASSQFPEGNIGPGTPDSDCPFRLLSSVLRPSIYPGSSPQPLPPALASVCSKGHSSHPLPLLLRNHQGLPSSTAALSIL